MKAPDLGSNTIFPFRCYDSFEQWNLEYCVMPQNKKRVKKKKKEQQQQKNHHDEGVPRDKEVNPKRSPGPNRNHLIDKIQKWG